jgi:methionyl-tRNA synthetase
MEKVLYSVANTIKDIAILLQPIVPHISQKILQELGIVGAGGIVPFSKLSENLEPLSTIREPSIIVPRLNSR